MGNTIFKVLEFRIKLTDSLINAIKNSKKANAAFEVHENKYTLIRHGKVRINQKVFEYANRGVRITYPDKTVRFISNTAWNSMAIDI